MNLSRLWKNFVSLCFSLCLHGGIGKTAQADKLNIERLTWAGVKLVAGDTTVLIDAVGTDQWNGNAPEGLVPVTVETGRRYAFVSR